MRSTLVLPALFFFYTLPGQEKNATYLSFALANKEVVWVQLYETSQPLDSLRKEVSDLLKHKAWITNIRDDGADIVADMANFRVDYKRYGGKYLNTSNLIRTARWSGKVRISFRDGRYRVVVYGLEYDARQPAMHAAKRSNESHMVHGAWTHWVLNNYRTHFKKNRFINMDLMHFNLKDSFTLTETGLIDNEW